MRPVPVSDLRGLTEGVEALLDGQQRRGLEGVHITSTAHGHGPCCCSPVVGEIDHTHEVVVTEAVVQALDREL